ncbi:MAG: hypothetical protein AABO41_03780 [Acidobacteriota bacterium]
MFSEVEDKGYFHVSFRGCELELAAGRYIGLIPINPQITIDVRPKLPVGNLARVIDLGQQVIDSLKVTRFYATNAESTISITEFLANNLLTALRQVELQGLYKKYRQRIENSSRPKGRINFPLTSKLNFSKGIRHKLYSSHFEHTIDNPYNQLLKYALWFLAQRLTRNSSRNRKLVYDVNKALGLFNKVTLSPSEQLVERVRDHINNKRIPFSRGYYQSALGIALTIVSGKGLSLLTRGHEVELSSYIIDFETLFEDYLRNVLRTRFAAILPDSRIRNGNKEGKKRMFDDTRKHLVEPDIVIDRPPNVLGIAEVKYKDRIDRPDINQAITYGCSYKTDNVVLVHQSAAGTKSGWQLLGTVGSMRVFLYAFDLANPNLEAEEQAFSDSIKGIVDTSA